MQGNPGVREGNEGGEVHGRWDDLEMTMEGEKGGERRGREVLASHTLRLLETTLSLIFVYTLPGIAIYTFMK